MPLAKIEDYMHSFLTKKITCFYLGGGGWGPVGGRVGWGRELRKSSIFIDREIISIFLNVLSRVLSCIIVYAQPIVFYFNSLLT